MILFELKMELWKIIQWNKIEFGFQIKPNSDRIWIRIWNKKQGGFFPHGKLIFLSPLRRCTKFLKIIQWEFSATRDKEERKRFPRWRFCNYLKLNPNHPIPPINWIWPSHSIYNSRDWRIPNRESTRGKIPNCLGCSRELGDEPSQERRPDSLIKRKGAHTPS